MHKKLKIIEKKIKIKSNTFIHCSHDFQIFTKSFIDIIIQIIKKVIS